MRTDNSWLGSAEGPGGSYIVGSYGTFKIVYTVGKYGIDDGGSIRVARRGGMRPQVDDPKAPGYTTVTCSRDVRLIADSIPITRTLSKEIELFGSARSTLRASHIRPFWSAFQVDVKDGSLYEGDQLVFTFGDTSRGSPGIQLKTSREAEYLFKVFVDPFGTGLYKPVEGSPSITIIGEMVSQIQVVGPSHVVAGSPFDVTVRALDIYGNRSDSYGGKVSFETKDSNAGLPESYEFIGKDAGAHRFPNVTLKKPGLQRITVRDDDGLHAVSNPIQVLEREPELKLYWGDAHGQTKETVGTGSVPEYLSFVRDVAALDFTAWQGNDFQITIPLWEHVKEQIRRYHDPGKFVTFLGYEWSGLTPGGGDHNIYFLGDDEQLYRSDHWLIEDKVDEDTDRYPISELWETFRGRKDVLAIPHVGGRHANLDFYDPEFIPVIEVHSNHGTFEWFLLEAMRRRMKVGFIAASDDHSSRPGLTYPSGGMTTRGGYTGVYAKELTREGLWEAFWARRTYGTTGERIIVHVMSDGHLMGEEYSTDKTPEIKVKIVGTAPLHEVEIYNWDELIYRHPFAEPKDDSEKLIKIEWSGARVRSRPKVVTWDGGLKVKNGRITDHTEFAFDYPYQGVEKVSDSELRWRSTTGGDPDGVLLRLEGNDETEVTFDTGPTTFTFKPKDIQYEAKVIEAGGLNQRVKVSTIRDELPDTLEFSYKANSTMNGLNAYWVRIVQADGTMAWTSPIFINW
ncbi:MAG: DUF3604 domain-containing protein [Candidatus Bathyarchaeota archaeon]|nr:DUF3604 domain-containing protein [Candidatus Bathyarchaeota archaeon]